MARVVVVGGGFGGLASAVRLAKLGHQVTLVDQADRFGGALGFVESEGFRWDSGPTYTVLPAVVRDLFRKSGRPVEKELELVPLELLRQHRYDDGTVLDLPGGSLGGQLEAVDTAFGPGTGEQWVGYLRPFAEVWDVLRRNWLERPWDPEHADKEARELLATRTTLARYAQRHLKDERLRQLVTASAVAEGHDPRNVPAWVGMWAYVEQRFGAWRVSGGMGRLAEALSARLETRGVTALTRTKVHDLAVEGGRVVGIHSSAGSIDADVVVCAIDPRRLPALAAEVVRTMPAIPPVLAHLGLVGEVPDLPHEVILHGDPMLVLRTGGSAPAGAHAWTVLGRGKLQEDIAVSLARTGIKIRQQVEVRVDRSPRELVEQWGGSPYGVLWQGRGTVRQRMGTRTPVEGVFMAGAHTTPGAGLPSVGLSAALVAQCVGPA